MRAAYRRLRDGYLGPRPRFVGQPNAGRHLRPSLGRARRERRANRNQRPRILKSLTMTNFRKFTEHELPLRPISILVGPNNAGKSAAIEALRLASLVANRSSSINFQSPPDWLEEPAATQGVSPSLRDFHSNLRTAFNQYKGYPCECSDHKIWVLETNNTNTK
ncbi:MAG: AAA family ATPase [Acidimicrobiales bacterium]